MVDDELRTLAHDVDRQCRLTGEFVLRSGGTATEYFDKYLFEGDPVLLRRVVERMVRLIPPDTDMLGDWSWAAYHWPHCSARSPVSLSFSYANKPRATGPDTSSKDRGRLAAPCCWSRT